MPINHPDAQEIFSLPRENKVVTDFLANRRSNLAKMMEGAGPNEAQLNDILTIAARVPDHRKLMPWRFIVFQGDARTNFGQHLAEKFKSDNPATPEDKVTFEAQRLMRAPIVVAVISSPKDCIRGTPEWEQILSSEAVCYNMVLAAQSMGFGAQWLTEWFAYDREILDLLGLTETEKISGFVYLGQTSVQARERLRPDIMKIVKNYSEG